MYDAELKTRGIDRPSGSSLRSTELNEDAIVEVYHTLQALDVRVGRG
jgi:hypothetical protein